MDVISARPRLFAFWHPTVRRLFPPPAMSFYLAVVSPNDAPLFELAFSSTKPPPPATATSTSSFPSWSTFTATNSHSSSSSSGGGGGDAASHDAARPTTSGPLMESKSAPQRDRAMCQMVAHMSLDSVEEIMEGTGALYAPPTVSGLGSPVGDRWLTQV